MAEQIDLTSADQVASGTLTYRPIQLILTRGADPPNDSFIEALFRGDNAESLRAQWTGDSAWTLLKQLNTANLSSISLEKRLISRAISDAKLPAGTISGTPDT